MKLLHLLLMNLYNIVWQSMNTHVNLGKCGKVVKLKLHQEFEFMFDYHHSFLRHTCSIVSTIALNLLIAFKRYHNTLWKINNYKLMVSWKNTSLINHMHMDGVELHPMQNLVLTEKFQIYQAQIYQARFWS